MAVFLGTQVSAYEQALQGLTDEDKARAEAFRQLCDNAERAGMLDTGESTCEQRTLEAIEYYRNNPSET